MKFSGITLQGDDRVYSRSGVANIHKGHLNPCAINSYSRNYMLATFVYTNAVPQCGSSFNSGSWGTFEKKIKNYTKTVCAGTHGGTMYLVTGQSRYGIQVSSSGAISQVVGGPVSSQQLCTRALVGDFKTYRSRAVRRGFAWSRGNEVVHSLSQTLHHSFQ